MFGGLKAYGGVLVRRKGRFVDEVSGSRDRNECMYSSITVCTPVREEEDCVRGMGKTRHETSAVKDNRKAN